MLQIHLDTVFHAHMPIMSKIRYALCAWGGFLTQTQKGMINAFLRRMCKYRYHFVSVCFDIDAIMVDIGRTFFKVLFFPAHCLHSLLPPVKSNPNGLHSRDHNFQLPVCNFNFRRNSFIIRSLFRFKLNFFYRFLLSCLYVFLIARSYFLYACSIVYFTCCTIAILTALNSVACTFVTCFSINTQYLLCVCRGMLL